MPSQDWKKLLQQCDAQTLHEIIGLSRELLRLTEPAPDESPDHAAQRAEARFETNLLGTLTRITDVKPGEKREYSVTIRDVSRSGMRLVVDSRFTPSRIVEVAFASPGGKLKRTTLEIVRVSRMANENGKWVELGCRTVGDEHVRKLQLQEKKAAEIRENFHARTGLVLAVGPETRETAQLVARLKTANFQVRLLTGLRQALNSAQRLNAQLAILCQGSIIAQDPERIADLQLAPVSLATLALIHDENDRFALLRAGVDEVLLVTGDRRDDILLYAMERTLVGHGISAVAHATRNAAALILTPDSMKASLLSYRLEENGYGCTVVSNLDRATDPQLPTFDLLLADHQFFTPQCLPLLKDRFPDQPLVAICDDIVSGRQAVAAGAINYVTMPPGREEIQMILNAANHQPA